MKARRPADGQTDRIVSSIQEVSNQVTIQNEPGGGWWWLKMHLSYSNERVREPPGKKKKKRHML